LRQEVALGRLGEVPTNCCLQCWTIPRTPRDDARPSVRVRRREHYGLPGPGDSYARRTMSALSSSAATVMEDHGLAVVLPERVDLGRLPAGATRACYCRR
jgi:hypothetical protein